MQIYYYELLCPNSGMLYVPLHAKVLVLIDWGRYICMKQEIRQDHLLCKGNLERGLPGMELDISVKRN